MKNSAFLCCRFSVAISLRISWKRLLGLLLIRFSNCCLFYFNRPDTWNSVLKVCYLHTFLSKAIDHAPNAFKIIDNAFQLIIYCFQCVRRVRSATFDLGLRRGFGPELLNKIASVISSCFKGELVMSDKC